MCWYACSRKTGQTSRKNCQTGQMSFLAQLTSFIYLSLLDVIYITFSLEKWMAKPGKPLVWCICTFCLVVNANYCRPHHRRKRECEKASTYFLLSHYILLSHTYYFLFCESLRVYLCLFVFVHWDGSIQKLPMKLKIKKWYVLG